MTLWMAVEDEPDLYNLVIQMYELMGVKGLVFTDGEEAIKWIDGVDANEYEGEFPELALLDIRLPGKNDGAMVGRRIRNSSRLKNMVIILMTAYKLSPLQEEAYINLAEADWFLNKPLPGVQELQQIFSKARMKRKLKR